MSVYIIKAPDHRIYVGSTNRPIRKRQAEHQSECFNPERASYHSPLYTHLRKCGMKPEDIKCEVIVKCDATINLRAMEAKWIRHIGSLNSKLSIEDLEKNEARKQKYREQGKIKQECPCGGCWTYKHKRRHYKTKKHQEWLEEEHQKKIKYLNSINAAKEEAIKIKTIPLHYDDKKNIFIKEGDGVQNPQGGQGLHD
jgi:predicted GIY-YIG superfamily endonuclease